MKRNRKVKYPLELEYGKTTIEYEVVAEVSPYVPGYTSGPPEKCYPSEGPEVEDVEVWATWNKICDEPCAKYIGGIHESSCPKCHGTGLVKCRERRPEIEEVIDPDDVIEHLEKEDGDY